MNNDRFPWRRYVWRRVVRLPHHRRAPASFDRGRPVDGFTLIELTVGIALLGLIAVMILGGVRFGTRVWQTGADISERRAEVMVVQNLLRRQLMQAVASELPTRQPGRGDLFDGSRDVMNFVAPLPQRLGEGSLFSHVLFLSGQGDETELRLSWRTFDRATGVTVDPNASGGDETVLLDDVADVRFEYFDAGDQRSGWQDGWREKRLPALVRVSVEFDAGDGRYWPAMTIATNPGMWGAAVACSETYAASTRYEVGGFGRASRKCGRQTLSFNLQ